VEGRAVPRLYRRAKRGYLQLATAVAGCSNRAFCIVVDLDRAVQGDARTSADPDVSPHGLEAIWCTRAARCAQPRLIVAARRLAAPGRMLRVPSLWAVRLHHSSGSAQTKIILEHATVPSGGSSTSGGGEGVS